MTSNYRQLMQSSAIPEIRRDFPQESVFMARLYPRSRWLTAATHPTALRWLQAHAWFRETLDSLLALKETAGAATVGAHRQFASLLQRADTFLAVLDAHHHSESEIYFPRLASADARISYGIDVLESDHHRINFALIELAASVRSSNRVRRPGRDADFSLLFGLLETVKVQLEPHLSDEEDLVIPFLSLRGDPVTGEPAVIRR